MRKICIKRNRIKAEIKIIFYTALKIITKRKMIIDITGTLLTPGNFGEDCRGNGIHLSRFGNLIECCCDECDYMMCCLEENSADKCLQCTDMNCPHSKKD